MMKTDKKRPINRGLLFIGSYAGIFLAATNATFSIVSRGLADANGWVLNDLTFAYPLNLLVLCIVGIFAGVYSDKNGTSNLMLFGCLFGAAGWILTGFSVNPLMFYLSFGLICGVAEGLLYTPVLTQTLKWFPEKKGVMSGALLSAAALGPFIMGPMFGSGFRSLGVSAVLAIFGCGFLVVLVLFRRYQPGAGRAARAGEDCAGESSDIPPSRMLCSPAFYVLILLLMALSCGGNMMIGTLYTIAIEQVHLPAEQAAWVVSISTLSNLGGRLSFGPINDRIGSQRSLVFGIVFTMAALLVLCTSAAAHRIVFCCCVAVIGFCFAGPLVIFPTLTQRFFGSKYFGVNYGIVFLGYSIAAFIGPRIALNLFTQTGSFDDAYVIAAAITALGVVLLGLLGLLQKKRACRAV